MASVGAAALTAVSLATPDQAFTNACYVHPSELDKLIAAGGHTDEARIAKLREIGLLCAVGEAVFIVRGEATISPGTIALGHPQRQAGRVSVDKPTPVSPFRPPPGSFAIGTMELEVFLGPRTPPDLTVDASELAEHIRRKYSGHVFKPGQAFFTNFNDSIALRLVVAGMDLVDVGGSGGKPGASAGAAAAPVRFGMLLRESSVALRKGADVAIKLTGSATGKSQQLFDKGFNFEALGIGGLNKEFQDIFRRAFASRVIPPDIMRKMGQHHVRGMLLYGPPGCGKTLIARQIAKALRSHPPKIVNGPEILNKYVGQSEENIRALFKDAEKEQSEKGDDSDLHIIIFDEIDAICRQRGTTGGGTGVNDSIVNQLLSKIDGVEALNNILLIGMTNRKDMIDEAILRPGRLEVHIEIGLPDDEGRLQILNIHTAEMRHNNMLAADVDLPTIAERTKNYTGAEIEGLVKAAASYVFQREIDPSDLTKKTDWKGVQVSMADFERALIDVPPAFGVKEDELARCAPNGIISYGEEFDRFYTTLKRLTHQVATSERTPLVSVLLKGASGTGKTAIAARAAMESGFPFVKRISGETLVSLHETGKADAITKVFNDAYKSPLSLIILDDIERLLEYVSLGPRFSNTVLQTLLVLVKALPPKGRRLFIIGTTAVADLLEHMELTSSFQLALPMPDIATQEEYAAVLSATKVMNDADVRAAAGFLAGRTSVPIKKLLTMVDMARSTEEATAAGTVTYQQFAETLLEWHVS